MNDEALEAMAAAAEVEIVWVRPPWRYRYVRQSVVISSSRGRVLGCSSVPGRVVAYAVVGLSSNQVDGGYPRRVWWVRNDDPYPGGCPASEGVPVESVRMGVEGGVN